MPEPHPDLDALDASLDTDDPGVIRHLADCGRCRRELEGLAQLRRRLRDLRTVDPPLPEHWDSFVHRVTGLAGSPRTAARERPQRSPRRAHVLAAAATALVVASVPAYLVRLRNTDSVRTAASTSVTATAGGSVTVVSTGTAYSRRNAPEAVRRVVAGAAGTPGRAHVAGVPTSTGCPIPPAGAHAEIIDHGRFDGRPTTVYITRSGGKFTATFVGADCHPTTLSGL